MRRRTAIDTGLAARTGNAGNSAHSNSITPTAALLAQLDPDKYEEDLNLRIDGPVQTLSETIVQLIGLATVRSESLFSFIAADVAFRIAQVGSKDPFEANEQAFQSDIRIANMVRRLAAFTATNSSSAGESHRQSSGALTYSQDDASAELGGDDSQNSQI